MDFAPEVFVIDLAKFVIHRKPQDKKRDEKGKKNVDSSLFFSGGLEPISSYTEEISWRHHGQVPILKSR